MKSVAFRLPFRGEPITVVTSGNHTVRARAAGFVIHNNEKWLRWRQTRGKMRGRVQLEDEGATWVRGWKGDRVTAMRTVVAFRRMDSA